MKILSEEFEEELTRTIGKIVQEKLDDIKPQQLDLISRKDLVKHLDISTTTLREWEANGLKRSQIPFSKLVFYRLEDIYEFMQL